MLVLENIGLCPNIDIVVMCHVYTGFEELLIHKREEFEDGTIYVLDKGRDGYKWFVNVGEMVYSPWLNLKVKPSALKYGFTLILDKISPHARKLDNLEELHLNILNEVDSDNLKFSVIARTGREKKENYFGECVRLYLLENDDVEHLTPTTVRLERPDLNDTYEDFEELIYDAAAGEFIWGEYKTESVALGVLTREMDCESIRKIAADHLISLCGISVIFCDGFAIRKDRTYFIYMWDNVALNGGIKAGINIWRAKKKC